MSNLRVQELQLQKCEATVLSATVMLVDHTDTGTIDLTAESDEECERSNSVESGSGKKRRRSGAR